MRKEIINRESANFNKVIKSFKDKWVAVSYDYSKVFASGDTLQQVMSKTGTKSKVKVLKVIPLDLIYSPYA